MTLTSVLKHLQKFTIDNSPAILTAIGVTGTLTTSYLTGKASFKAAEVIRLAEEQGGTAEPGLPLLKEHVRLVWKLYLPAAGMGFLTVGSIILANRIGTRRAAALAAAYSISEKAFAEYKEKVVEKFGEKKEQAVRDAVAQDRVTNNPPGREVIIAGSGDVLCYDTFTGRYFNSDMETLKSAQNKVNYRVLNDMYASLTDFYNEVGLPPTAYSEEVGWNSDKLMELEFSATISDDGRPCIAVGFAVAPVRDYYRLQ